MPHARHTAASLFFLIAVFSASAAELTWDADTGTGGSQDGSGGWSTGGNNWWDGAVNVPWTSGDSAIIGAGGQPGTINVDGAGVTLGGLKFNPIDHSGDGQYTVNGGAITFTGSSPVITVNIPRDQAGTISQLYTLVNAPIAGSNISVSSDITSPADTNKVGIIQFGGANTNTGTFTVNANSTVWFTEASSLSAGLTGIVVNPRGNLDLSFSGTVSTPITIGSLGISTTGGDGVPASHTTIAPSNGGGLRLGDNSATGTFDLQSPITFTGDTEIRAAATSGTGIINTVLINTALTSTHQIQLRTSQRSVMTVNQPINALNLGLQLSTSGEGSTMNINAAVNANDLFVATSASGQLNINAPITLGTTSGLGKATVASSAGSSAATNVNATITAPGGIEFQRGMTTVNLNSTSGFALDTSEVLLTPTGGTGNTLVVAKADDQISHNAVVHYSGTGTTRTLRLEGHTLTLGGLQTTNVTTASQAVVQNTLANSTGHLIVNDNSNRTFGGLLQNGSGTESLLAITKQGTGNLSLTNSNTFSGNTTVSGGTLSLVGSGGINSSAVIQIDAGATLDVTARTAGFAVGATQTLKGNGTVVGSVNTVAGSVIAPGASIGTLTINGDATLISTLAIEYSGSTIDKLAVSGTLNITAATIDFNPLTSLTTSALVLASYNTLAGSAFAAVVDLPSGYIINYNYLGNKQIALVQAGDFDGDGDVDGADFIAWQTNYPTGSGATIAQGDADGDTDVDGADFAAWQSNFPSTPSPGTSPVPEPEGIFIFGTGCLGIALVWRSRISRKAIVAMQ